MYEAAGNTAMKEDMRAKAVTIRQKDEYSGKYSNADDGGSYVDSYEYHSDKYQQKIAKRGCGLFFGQIRQSKLLEP